MNVTFRPAVERLDARDLPAIGIFSDILVTSVVAPPPTAPTAPAVVHLAPTADGAVHAGYDLKALKKV